MIDTGLYMVFITYNRINGYRWRDLKAKNWGIQPTRQGITNRGQIQCREPFLAGHLSPRSCEDRGTDQAQGQGWQIFWCRWLAFQAIVPSKMSVFQLAVLSWINPMLDNLSFAWAKCCFMGGIHTIPKWQLFMALGFADYTFYIILCQLNWDQFGRHLP